MRATIPQSICRFGCSWIGEWKLIGTLWSGKFPSAESKYPLSYLERTVMTVLIGIRTVSLIRIKDLFSRRNTRSALSELYNVIWFLALVILLVKSFTSTTLMVLIVGYRIMDSVNYRLCILFVDRYQSDWGLRSLNRSLILLLINYLELIVAFAVLYLQTQSVGADKVVLTDWGQALYFSLVTITTLGYGDELLSRVAFARLNQAAIWSSSITSIPSLNLIPVTTFAR